MKGRASVKFVVSLAAACLLGLGGGGASFAVSSPHVPAINHVMLDLFHTRALPTHTELVGVPCVVECVSPLLYGGGPVQHSPAVYITFWGWHGSDPAGVAPYLQSFFNGVGGSAWANIQTQYTDGAGAVQNPSGQLKGVWWDDSSTPGSIILDQAVADEAVKAAQHFGYNPDADYFVATPHGTGTAGFAGVGGSYCAYHGMQASSAGPVYFTNLPYIPDAGAACGQNFVNANGPLDGVSIVGGHEYAEAITDPGVGSGYVDLNGYETGDKCAWVQVGPGTAGNIQLSTGTFPVQSLYSNAANPVVGGCVLAY